jgi:site-specific DNA recombinase
MGGLPSLGYDVTNRKLVVNEEEAPTVLHIFRRYAELRSVRALKGELDAAGIRSKRRLLMNGTPFGGQRLSRGALYLMLKNRIYRGEITHKGKRLSRRASADCRRGFVEPGSGDPRREPRVSRHRQG